jgi:hypothetical protein
MKARYPSSNVIRSGWGSGPGIMVVPCHSSPRARDGFSFPFPITGVLPDHPGIPAIPETGRIRMKQDFSRAEGCRDAFFAPWPGSRGAVRDKGGLLQTARPAKER